MNDKQTKAYSVKETAQMLGVTPVTVYNWLWSGDIRGVKAGPKLWRIPASEIERMTVPFVDHPQDDDGRL